MPRASRIDKTSPLFPAEYKKKDVLAIQALLNGVANEEQQAHALSYIINELCKTYDMPYRPGEDGARESDFAMGKMHVGQQLVKMTKLKVANIKD